MTYKYYLEQPDPEKAAVVENEKEAQRRKEEQEWARNTENPSAPLVPKTEVPS